MDKLPQWTHAILMCAPGITGAVTGVSAAIALKTYRPECRVTCLVSGDAAPLLERHPAVDQALSDLSFRDLVAFFRRQSSGLVLLLTSSPGGFVAAMLARVPVRIRCGAGMGRMERALAWFFGRQEGGVETSVLKALRIMGLPSRLPARPWVVLTPRERRRALRRLRRVSRPRVLVHPSGLTGSPGLLHARWSLVLAGLRAQECELRSLSQWVERGAVNLIGKLSLREWLAVLIECDVLISADDESLFLADAMGVPTVRLDPPSANGELSPVLPEAVPWQVEAVLRHRLRVLGRGVEKPYAGII